MTEEGEIVNNNQLNSLIDEGGHTPEWEENNSNSQNNKKKKNKKHKKKKSKSIEKSKKKLKKQQKEYDKHKKYVQHKSTKIILQNKQTNKEDVKQKQMTKQKQQLQEDQKSQNNEQQLQQQQSPLQEIIFEEDEEEVFYRRRKQREELFKQYEQDKQDSPRQEIEQEFNFEETDRQIDENKQNYFRMLDQQRNLNNQKVEQQIEKKTTIDMFDEQEDDIEHDDLNTMTKNKTMISYEADDEKYYRITIGETIKDYKIVNKCGKGVFGNVCKAIKDKEEYAIKFIRAEDIYFRSGERERSILKLLNEADKTNKKHILRLIESFDCGKHLCLVFESLDMNLRDAIKIYSKGQGLDLNSIKSYAMQLFVALSHLKKHNIIHADIKPDNILISSDTKLLKLCDFGTAFTIDEVTVVEYLVSRFYRAPEIIIGYPYDTAIDVWAAGCTLYELYTGQFLFSGDNNCDMLKLHLQTMGKFSMKMLRRSALTSKYFDQHLNFKSREIDPITKQTILKPVLLGERPTRSISTLLKSKEQSLSVEDQKKLLQFKDLLEKCLQLDPKNRLTPEEALYHPFINAAMIKTEYKRM